MPSTITPKPRKPRASALKAAPPVQRNEDMVKQNSSTQCSHRDSYVFNRVLLGLIFLVIIVCVLMMAPFFVPARSLLSQKTKAIMCKEYMHEIGMTQGQNTGVGSSNDTVCTAEYNPVCGELDVQCFQAPCLPLRETYSNECNAKKSGARIVSRGACPAEARKEIKLSGILADSKVVSPVRLTGMALGSSFFEGSMPVQIVDENGKILGEGPVVTNEDWARAALNGEQVSFNGSISFKKGTAQKGFIIFKHDNPSGLPENEVELLRIAVKF
jgi:hypothetical protein